MHWVALGEIILCLQSIQTGRRAAMMINKLWPICGHSVFLNNYLCFPKEEQKILHGIWPKKETELANLLPLKTRPFESTCMEKCQKCQASFMGHEFPLFHIARYLFVIRIVAKILCTMNYAYNCTKTKQSPFPLLKNRASRIVIWNYRTYFRPANEINVVLRIVYGISKCNNNVLYGVCIRVLKLFDVLVIPKFERKEYQGDDEQKKLLVRYTVIY